MKQIGILFIVFGVLSAQQWQWPEHPKNLTVLPSTTNAQELSRTMKGFTNALGVRCTFCHVGEEGKNLSEFDFVSDSKPEKNKARMMMAMVNSINGRYLPQVHDEDDSPISVNCQTCHRGNSRPILLEDLLKRTVDAFGLDSMISQYRTLREEYYGGFTYNFKEGTLLRLSDMLMEDSSKSAEAIAVVKLNIEFYPDFAFSYIHLGSYYEDRGNIGAALEQYRHALSMNPKNEFLKRKIDRLQKP